jgi:hypothetical protein
MEWERMRENGERNKGKLGEGAKEGMKSRGDYILPHWGVVKW